jgi:hypothetical protein
VTGDADDAGMTTSIRAAALLATTLLLAGCGRPGAPAPTSAQQPATTSPAAATTTSTTTAPGPATTTAPAATAPTPAAPRTTRAPERLSSTSRLRIDGLGPVAVGMTAGQARAAAGVPLTPTTALTPFCRGLSPTEGPAGVSFVLAGGDHVDWVTVSSGPIGTLSGIYVGSTEAQVLAAYPGQVRVANPTESYHRAVYTARDARYAHLSLVFQIVDGRVSQMTAGVRTAVEADEPCS